MESHSQTNNTLDAGRILEAQLRECFGRVVYSHKAHEKCADILLTRLSRIKLTQIVLSAISTAGFVATFFGAGKIGVTIGLVISTALLVLNAYTKDYDLGEAAQKHRQAAADLWLVREKYFSLLTDLAMSARPLATLQTERDSLLEQLHAAYKGAPNTTFKGYSKAQAALKKYEDMTFSDEEIDAFLPKALKRSSNTHTSP